MDTSNTHVLHLAPGPEPKKLTARASTPNLEEHRKAFANQNNKKGFPQESDPERSPTFQEIVDDFKSRKTVTLEAFQNAANRLHKLSPDDLPHEYCLNVLAKAVGYSSHYEVKKKALLGMVSNKLRRSFGSRA